MTDSRTPGFRVGLVESDADLTGVLALQRQCRTPTADGFVTVRHTLDVLRRMHELAPSVVARDAQGAIVGYALVMRYEARSWLPILEPMFEVIAALPAEVLGNTARWYVMGQIAVDPGYRGMGVFDALYAGHRRHYRDAFDWVITEVASGNTRSLRAHERVGFRTLHRYRDDSDDWLLIGWDWSDRMRSKRDVKA